MVKKKVLSGKFVLRTGADLHRRIYDYARSNGLSLNDACLSLINKAFDANQTTETLPFELDRLISEKTSFRNEVIGIVLYGSTARGDNSKTSLINFFVLPNSTVTCKDTSINKFIFPSKAPIN